jgi:aspartate racemase
MADLARLLVERGADAVLAACTEIPLVLGSADVPVPLVSSTAALARRTVELARRELPLPVRAD